MAGHETIGQGDDIKFPYRPLNKFIKPLMYMGFLELLSLTAFPLTP